MSELNGANWNFNNPVSNNNIITKQQGQLKTSNENNDEAGRIDNLSNTHAEVIGRSMVSGDSMKNDLNALIDNPKIAETSNKIFEYTYNRALQDNVENPYEEAVSFSTVQL